jgi:heavy metal translocating P-type ATPase
VVDVGVDAVAPGDLLLVRPGELVPVDAVVVGGATTVDESTLTGEPLPVAKGPGDALRGGTITVEGPLDVRAARPSRESEYAQIVRLMAAAQAERPRVQRVADRVAVWFTPVVLAAAALVFALTREPGRVLAVLVVATPCPLILATPVAILGGINRAARRGIIVKHGAALEQLGRTRVAVFDKTGTLTYGRPRVRHVEGVPPGPPGVDAAALLRWAAAVEVGSGHLLARAVVGAATRAGGPLPPVTGFREPPGRGAAGVVEGHRVAVGSLPFAAAATGAPPDARCAARVAAAAAHAEPAAVVAVDGRCAGVLRYADAVRPGLPALLARLRALGVGRTVMLTGDPAATARAVAARAGIAAVRAGLRPAATVAAGRALRAASPGVLMVGDGVNDAPALAAASVGVALGARGAAVSAAAADAVLLVDDVGRVADALELSRRTLRIVRQGLGAGLGASALALLLAGLGRLDPGAGAVLQEAIDAAGILNALRAR